MRATLSQAPVTGITAPILPMHFQKQRTKLRLFTTIATLGTPQDITLQALRIESFFPMDQETREVFRNWAGERRKKKTQIELGRQRIVMRALRDDAQPDNVI